MGNEIRKIVINVVGDVDIVDALCVVCEKFLQCILEYREHAPRKEVDTDFIVNSLMAFGMNKIAEGARATSANLQLKKKRRALERLRGAPYVSRNRHIELAKLLLEDESQIDMYDTLISQK